MYNYNNKHFFYSGLLQTNFSNRFHYILQLLKEVCLFYEMEESDGQQLQTALLKLFGSLNFL